jgi:hypothetical protein
LRSGLDVNSLADGTTLERENVDRCSFMVISCRRGGADRRLS